MGVHSLKVGPWMHPPAPLEPGLLAWSTGRQDCPPPAGPGAPPPPPSLLYPFLCPFLFQGPWGYF